MVLRHKIDIQFIIVYLIKPQHIRMVQQLKQTNLRVNEGSFVRLGYFLDGPQGFGLFFIFTNEYLAEGSFPDFLLNKKLTF